VAATILDGRYCENHTSRLISPPLLVGDAQQDLRVYFEHWFSFGSSNDYGEVHLRVVGDDTWSIISDRFTGSSGGYSPGSTDDLSAWANQYVQIAFYFQSQDDATGDDSSWGWYIDNPWCLWCPVATELKSYYTEHDGTDVVLHWEMSDIDPGVTFEVLRTDVANGDVVTLDGSTIEREELSFTFRDDTVEPGKTYIYDVFAADGGERRSMFRTERITVAPIETALMQNHPNPFNPTTTIRYDLAKKGHVSLVVYDVRGSVVRVLEDRSIPAGSHEATWNGRDEQGLPVASGIYFYRLVAPGFRDTRKMVLLK
jgi:hypothetical protein